MITPPKTPKSNRQIKMPQFLCEEVEDFLKILYGIETNDRMFTVTKSYLHHEMDRGAKEASIKRIRIHDIRHSHISLLIDMDFPLLQLRIVLDMRASTLLIIMLTYSHPDRQKWQIGWMLNVQRKGFDYVTKEC